MGIGLTMQPTAGRRKPCVSRQAGIQRQPNAMRQGCAAAGGVRERVGAAIAGDSAAERRYRFGVDGIRTALVIVHVTANVVWIGSILAVAYVLSADIGTSEERGRIGVGLYRRLAVPAFVISFTAGVARLAMSFDAYFVRAKWMHAKLLFVLVVIALHHVIGGRAKRMASGDKADAGPVPTLAVVLLLSAAAAIFFVIRQPF